jgi:hypothetical protein
MATTAEWLIYAIGGGHGHARRGFLLQRLLSRAGMSALLLMRPGADRYLPEDAGPRLYAETLADVHLAWLRRNPPRKLIVDTFPAGWRGELDEAWLGRFEHTVLIARHGRDLPGRTDVYRRVLTPYPEQRSEWGEDEAPAGARAAGYVIDASHLAIHGNGDSFAVLDPEARCEGRALALLSAAAKRAGLRFDYRQRTVPPFHCRKLLAAGAGYHTFYELLGLGLDLRFLPVRKRHDDQFRRAGRFGLALTRPDAVLPWLTAPCRPVAEDTRPDWPRLSSLLLE